jgi:hypothetical protein
MSGQSGRISGAGVWPRPRRAWSVAAILPVITSGIAIGVPLRPEGVLPPVGGVAC